MGASFRVNFSNPFEYNVFGIITGSSVAQFPDVPCELARLVAYTANKGSFFIGHSTSSCTWEIDASVDTGWFGIDNLNNLYVLNGSGSSDYLAYWIQK
jgi:hypothetical protein